MPPRLYTSAYSRPYLRDGVEMKFKAVRMPHPPDYIGAYLSRVASF
jgi:hypothetical protein